MAFTQTLASDNGAAVVIRRTPFCRCQKHGTATQGLEGDLRSPLRHLFSAPWQHFLLIGLVCTFGAWRLALAHSFAPVRLVLREVSPHQWLATWRAGVFSPTGFRVGLPEACQPRELVSPGATRFHCAAPGLAHATLQFQFPADFSAELWIEAEYADGRHFSGPVRKTEAEFLLFHPDRLPLFLLFTSYIRLGVEHILIGWDHLLFLTALLLGMPSLRPLLAAITAFTLAHSLSLAVTLLGEWQFPPAAVEVLIALSIVLVAREQVRSPTRQASTAFHLAAVTFGFGLVHGLGFATALRELGVPNQHLHWALAAFNVGVEFGQFVFVAALVPVLFLWQRHVSSRTAWRDLPGWAVGIAGALLTLERLAG